MTQFISKKKKTVYRNSTQKKENPPKEKLQSMNFRIHPIFLGFPGQLYVVYNKID